MRALPTGKISAALLAELLDEGPPLPSEVLLGPRPGEDACVIETAEGVLVVATDPITMTGVGVGAHAVLINANDVAVCGVRPRYFLASILFPEGTTESDVRALFRGMRSALDEVGAVLVGGHTEVTPSVIQPVITGQMLGTAPPGGFVGTGGASPGEVLVQVGPAPIEGGAILAESGAERVSPALAERARNALADPGICVVEPALLASELGAKAMHDPTEGGLSAGLWELAEASGLRIALSEQEVLWFEPGCALCRAFGADPWGTLASGTLLAVFPAPAAASALAALRARGFEAREIARLEPGSGVVAGGKALTRYERDELSRVLRES